MSNAEYSADNRDTTDGRLKDNAFARSAIIVQVLTYVIATLILIDTFFSVMNARGLFGEESLNLLLALPVIFLGLIISIILLIISAFVERHGGWHRLICVIIIIVALVLYYCISMAALGEAERINKEIRAAEAPAIHKPSDVKIHEPSDVKIHEPSDVQIDYWPHTVDANLGTESKLLVGKGKWLLTIDEVSEKKYAELTEEEKQKVVRLYMGDGQASEIDPDKLDSTYYAEYHYTLKYAGPQDAGSLGAKGIMVFGKTRKGKINCTSADISSDALLSQGQSETGVALSVYPHYGDCVGETTFTAMSMD